MGGQLRPLAYPQATAAYSTVDPATIPVSRVTGPAVLAVDESNGYGITGTVPTDIGPYALQLLRTSKDSAWKVSRLTPPVCPLTTAIYPASEKKGRTLWALKTQRYLAFPGSRPSSVTTAPPTSSWPGTPARWQPAESPAAAP